MLLIVSAQSDGVLFQEKIVSFQVQVNQAVIAIDVEGLAPSQGIVKEEAASVGSCNAISLSARLHVSFLEEWGSVFPFIFLSNRTTSLKSPYKSITFRVAHR